MSRLMGLISIWNNGAPRKGRVLEWRECGFGWKGHRFERACQEDAVEAMEGERERVLLSSMIDERERERRPGGASSGLCDY